MSVSRLYIYVKWFGECEEINNNSSVINWISAELLKSDWKELNGYRCVLCVFVKMCRIWKKCNRHD